LLREFCNLWSENPQNSNEGKYTHENYFAQTLSTRRASRARDHNPLGSLDSPAQAGYTVTLQQVGPNVVATGSGAINLTGLTFSQSATGANPGLRPSGAGYSAFISTGPASSSVDYYYSPTGPTSFGSSSFLTSASSGSGYMVGIFTSVLGNILIVPRGYVSGTALPGMAIYIGKTFAILGVTPGTYVWRWGIGANQKLHVKNPTGNPTGERASDRHN